MKLLKVPRIFLPTALKGCVAWAKEHGVTLVTAEHMGRSESYSAFKDAAKVDTWADAAMQWAVGSGIVTGSGTNLNPLANITRAEAATILYRYLTGNATKYTETVVTVTSADGTAVPATLCVPASATNAPGVVMLHGTGSARDEAGNGYKTAAPILAAQYGVATIRIDFRGNGDSKADYMPARLFFDIIRKLPDDTVSISVDEKFRVSIRGGISSFTITAMSADDYPELPDVDSEKGIQLPQRTLRDMAGF